MKTRNILLLLITTLLSATGYSQKSKFEGKIVYGITYDEMPEGMEQYSSMLASESTIYIKGAKTRTEQGTGMGGKQVVIADRKKGETVALMDIMGKKIKMILSEGDMKESKRNMENAQITYADEIKEIAGYQCKRATIVFEGEEDPVTIFYTEEISKENDSYFKGLKGFPLQYSINKNGFGMTMTAKQVIKEKVPDKLFDIPDGYEEMTREQMGKMFGGVIIKARVKARAQAGFTLAGFSRLFDNQFSAHYSTIRTR